MPQSSGETARTLLLIGMVLEAIAIPVFIPLGILSLSFVILGAFVLAVGVLALFWVVLIYVYSYSPAADGRYEVACSPTLVLGILTLILGGVAPGVLLLVAYAKLEDQVREGQDAERRAIADRVTDLLYAVDARDWNAAILPLGSSVSVDYTSLYGGEVVKEPAQNLITSWKSLLPGFDSTQHLLGPIRIRVDSTGKAHAVCAVTATHTLGSGRWVVGGQYDFELATRGPSWAIVGIRLRVAYVDGDRDLPNQARLRAAGPGPKK